MIVAQVLALLLVGGAGAVVAHTHDPVPQAIASGVFGTALAVVFLLLQAPGVAMAVVVVAGVAIPVMVLVTVTNIRGAER